MILLIDNYDSFVYNLERYCIELGQNVLTKRHDAVTIADIYQIRPKAIIVSPGPCSPKEAGISNDVILEFSGKVPILGVCLGHQCIGHVFGGQVIRAPKPIHGKTDFIQHQDIDDGRGIFSGFPSTIEVMRYHSLIVDSSTLPSCLIKTAWLKDQDMIMALRHKTHPTFGVQFHPESVKTQYGYEMLQNFLKFKN